MFDKHCSTTHSFNSAFLSNKNLTFGGDRYVHTLGCGDGFIDMYLCQNLSHETASSAVTCTCLIILVKSYLADLPF